MSAARKRRIWSVSDFAEHVGISHLRARRWLKRLDEKHGGRLLIPSTGMNRAFRLMPATLCKLEPDLFSPVESVEFRLDALEETTEALKLDQRRVIAQVGQNTRDIARIQRPKGAAA